VTSWLRGLLVPLRRRLGVSVLLGALTVASSLAMLATSGFLISKAALRPPVLDLAVAIVLVRAFGLTRGLFRYGERLVSHDLALRLLSGLRSWLYTRLEPLAPAGLDAFRSGDVLARLVSDVEALQDLFVRGLAPPMVAAIVLGLAVGVLWPLAPAAVATLAVPYVLAGAGLPWLLRRLARRPASARAELDGDLEAVLVELLQGAPDIAAFGREQAWLGRLQAVDAGLASSGRRLASLAGLGEGSGIALTGVATAGVLLVAVPLVQVGTLDGVWLATVALAAMAAFEAVQPLPVAFERLARSLASAARLRELTDAAPPVKDPSKPRSAQLGVLALEGAWLRYTPTAPWALAGVNFRLQPGRRVALVGPSGAGKTSVVNVLLRLRGLDRGRATLAGHDLREYAQEDLRRLIGLCTQDPHVFNTSVRENLLLARPKATMAEIEAAAGTVRLLDWVRALPQGWDTMVGERGTSVSGGQRQRVALARALLAGFEVLILDEPTAHLDAATAASVMDDVLLAAAGKTLLVITHRLEGLERFDEVMIMADGRVIERRPADLGRRGATPDGETVLAAGTGAERGLATAERS